MTTTKQFFELQAAVAAWYEALEDLLLMLQNDLPAHDNAALVGQIEDDVADALSFLDQIREHVARCEQLQQGTNPAQAAIQLSQAQRLLADLVAHMGGRMASPVRLQHIALIVQQRGPQWSGWSQVVLRSLSGWSSSAADTAKTLADAWMVLATLPDSAEKPAQESPAPNFSIIHQQN